MPKVIAWDQNDSWTAWVQPIQGAFLCDKMFPFGKEMSWEARIQQHGTGMSFLEGCCNKTQHRAWGHYGCYTECSLWGFLAETIIFLRLLANEWTIEPLSAQEKLQSRAGSHYVTVVRADALRGHWNGSGLVETAERSLVHSAKPCSIYMPKAWITGSSLSSPSCRSVHGILSLSLWNLLIVSNGSVVFAERHRVSPELGQSREAALTKLSSPKGSREVKLPF